MGQINFEAIQKKGKSTKVTKPKKERRKPIQLFSKGKQLESVENMANDAPIKKRKLLNFWTKRWVKRPKDATGTRSLKINHMRPSKIIAIIIWFFFGCSIIVSFISIAQYGVILKTLAQTVKTVRTLDETQSGQRASDFIIYQGEELLRAYLTAPSYTASAGIEISDEMPETEIKAITEAETKTQEIKRASKISSLSLNGFKLGDIQLSDDAHVDSVFFIKQSSSASKIYGTIYQLSYHVNLITNQVPLSLAVTLPATQTDGNFRLVGTPTWSQFETKQDHTKDKKYDSTALLTKGAEVEQDTQNTVKSFVNKFFEYYAAGDTEALALISNIKGLETKATINSISFKNMVEKDGVITVEGAITYDYASGNISIPTTYSLKLKASNDSYFVESMF